MLIFFFFFNDMATTEIYTLSLHDALPIARATTAHPSRRAAPTGPSPRCAPRPADRRAAPRRRRSPPGPWECAAPPGRSDDRRGSRPHRVAAPAQIGACFRDGGAAEVEQGGGEDAVGAGVERLRQMLERPRPARRDHRNRHRLRDGPREGEVVAAPGAPWRPPPPKEKGRTSRSGPGPPDQMRGPRSSGRAAISRTTSPPAPPASSRAASPTGPPAPPSAPTRPPSPPRPPATSRHG